MAKFVISRRINGEFQFNLKANNGQSILISEGYTTKTGCQNGIVITKANSKEDNRFDRKTSSNGKTYFNLKASNGQIIGTSEMYESTAARDQGIEAVKKEAAAATIEDLTA